MVSNSGTACAAIPGNDDAESDDDSIWLSASPVVDELSAEVPADAVGERIDRVAARLFPRHSRARIQAWIEDGRLLIDGKPATARTKPRGGEQLVLAPTPDPESLAYLPEPVDFPVVHEDGQVIVIDKPAGLVVHPAAGNWSGTLLNGLLHRYPELAGLPRAGIVHRLDKDTSGLMVVARTLEAQTDLVRQLQARSVSRRYLAVCWGRPADRAIDAPIGRDPRERTRMAVVPHGKPAVTHLRRLATVDFDVAGGPVSLIECRLDTGRTHQIRVHAAHIGFPLLGDPVYGNPRRVKLDRELLARQALHAWYLAFDHPDGRPDRPAFVAEPPPDFRALCERLGLLDGLALAARD